MKVSRMVQEIASQSEETASASEELNAQSEQAQEYVREIAKVVRGGKRQEVIDAKQFPEDRANVNLSGQQLLAAN